MWAVLVHKNHIALKYTYNIATIFLPRFFPSLLDVHGGGLGSVLTGEIRGLRGRKWGILNEYVYYCKAPERAQAASLSIRQRCTLCEESPQYVVPQNTSHGNLTKGLVDEASIYNWIRQKSKWCHMKSKKKLCKLICYYLQLWQKLTQRFWIILLPVYRAVLDLPLRWEMQRAKWSSWCMQYISIGIDIVQPAAAWHVAAA